MTTQSSELDFGSFPQGPRKSRHTKTIDKILEKVSSGVEDTPVDSFTVNACLRSFRTGEFLKHFRSGFESLEDRKDAAREIISQLAEFRSTSKGGRPKGITRDTNWQIMIAGALSFLGCPNAGMVQFLYPGLYSDHSNASGTDYALAGRGAVCKFLKRHAVAINQQKAGLTEKLAIQIVRAASPRRTPSR